MDPLISNTLNPHDPVSEAAAFASSVGIANIGPNEQRKRLQFGRVMFAIGFAIAAIIILAGVERAWRISLFLPFYLGAIGFFQARDKT